MEKPHSRLNIFTNVLFMITTVVFVLLLIAFFRMVHFKTTETVSCVVVSRLEELGTPKTFLEKGYESKAQQYLETAESQINSFINFFNSKFKTEIGDLNVSRLFYDTGETERVSLVCVPNDTHYVTTVLLDGERYKIRNKYLYDNCKVGNYLDLVCNVRRGEDNKLVGLEFVEIIRVQ